MPGEARQEYSRLPGRVSSSDNGDLVIAAHGRLHLGCAIVDSDAFELLDVGKIQFSITRACRNNNGATLNGSSVVQFHYVGRVEALEPAGGSSDRDVSSELFCLNKCAVGELLPGNPHGKTEVVFDSRTGAGLAARCIALQDKNVQAL